MMKVSYKDWDEWGRDHTTPICRKSFVLDVA